MANPIGRKCMCMCLCVCVYVCMYVCLCMHTNLDLHGCSCPGVLSMEVKMVFYFVVCICVYLHVWMYVYVCLDACIRMSGQRNKPSIFFDWTMQARRADTSAISAQQYFNEFVKRSATLNLSKGFQPITPNHITGMYLCVCVSVFLCVCIDVRMHVGRYECMYVCMSVCTYECVYVCMYGCMDGCIYAWMYLCLHVCLQGPVI